MQHLPRDRLQEPSADPVTDASSMPAADLSLSAVLDASSGALDDRWCGWCRAPLTDPRARYCCTRCRQTAWRLRQRSVVESSLSAPGVFAYADPPYPGCAQRYYGDQPTFAGEVDHRALIASLEAFGYAGWALSTSARALRDVLPLCPSTARVCAWVKPHGVPKATRGIHSAWEPVIVVGGRQRRPGVRDHLRALPARFGGELMGRKPIAFAAWLFDLLGMRTGDQFVDLFPGTGIITRAWASLSSRAPGDGRRYLSLAPGDDASGAALEDASSSAPSDGGWR